VCELELIGARRGMWRAIASKSSRRFSERERTGNLFFSVLQCRINRAIGLERSAFPPKKS